ncbi:Spindle and kinetochore-associated protein 3 [Oryzias melastigma]|uniref:Spindle and kinetochore-associated protein 3 n=1 Tax=Oryzias melastigma TaxID=30732 RepID=A0A834F126_ORYME|nr:Spindle and kinetochore-associated protein 3 [Oryzias melastigma]
MDPTSQFFSKLRKLAVSLESESGRLQRAYENRNNEPDSETTVRATRAYHELHGEVGGLKVQIQDTLTQQKARKGEVDSFIKACQVLEQRVTKDIQVVRTHLEQYGYQAPCNTHRALEPNDQGAKSENEAGESDKSSSVVEEGGNLDDDEEAPCLSPEKIELPFTDLMRTPQLSDFGLSEMQLKRALAGTEWCSEVPSMPEMSLPQPSLDTPAPPPIPITPKCALRMEDDELQMPQMHEFGITEKTMCLNNDFTMDLFRKKASKPNKAPEEIPALERLQTDILKSPEPPLLCTPGFKLKKTNGQFPPELNGDTDPESPPPHAHLATTPEVPAFQTPYVNRLVSSKKSAPQPEQVDMQTDEDSRTFKPQPPCNGAAGSKRTWDHHVPDSSAFGVEDAQMPEMPNLESDLGNSLQHRNRKISKTDKDVRGPAVSSLDSDGPTQEFSLGTPRIRTTFEEPSTPEMPDLSSVTQDICKLVSQAQKKKTTTATQPRISPLQPADSLCVVSQSEFQTLPNYLRRMTLSNLNQAVGNINTFSRAESR